ncbi:hypothetical protein [Streptomyces sp. 2A115]
MAADLKVTADTVRKWRSRFSDHRLEGLKQAAGLLYASRP